MLNGPSWYSQGPLCLCSEKEEKPELSIPFLYFKCVQELGILDWIKWASKIRMMGKQGAGRPLCPLGNEWREELHKQCLYSHSQREWAGKLEQHQDKASAKCFIDDNPPDHSEGLSMIGSSLETVLGHLWGSGRAYSGLVTATESSNPNADLCKGPLYSPSAGDGGEPLSLPCPAEMALKWGPG